MSIFYLQFCLKIFLDFLEICVGLRRTYTPTESLEYGVPLFGVGRMDAVLTLSKNNCKKTLNEEPYYFKV